MRLLLQGAWVVAWVWCTAVPLQADEARMHVTAAQAYLYSGKERQAFDEFVAALRSDPNQALPHFEIARIYEKRGEYPLAIQEYRAAVTIDPDHRNSRQALERLGFYVGTRPATPPGGSPAAAAQAARLEKSRALRAAGQFGAAVTVLEGLVKDSPGEGSLRLELARAYEESKDLARALEAFLQASRRLPESPDLHLAIGRVHYKRGSFAEALEEGRAALALSPRGAGTHRFLGQVLLTMGTKSEAYDHLREAARLEPADASLRTRVTDLATEVGFTHYNNGMFYFDTKNWRAAKDELELSLTQGNLNAEQRSIAQSRLVVARFNLARVKEQIDTIQKERALREFGYVDKRLLFDDVIRNPSIWKEGRQVDFKGWLVSMEKSSKGAILIVSSDRLDTFAGGGGDDRARRRDSTETLSSFSGPNQLGGSNLVESTGFGFRANTEMVRWFTVTVPRPLPDDDRIRVNSIIRVLGKLSKPGFIRNIYNGTFSRYSQPAVQASALEFRRETQLTEPIQSAAGQSGQGSSGRGSFDTGRFPIISDISTPPGIAGPLRLDFLTLPPEAR